MSDEPKVLTHRFEPPTELPEDLGRPEASDADAEGITVVNDTSSNVWVLAANEVLGPRSCGYVAPGQRLVLPVGWAWWDVYVLYTGAGSGLQIEWNPLVTWSYNRKRGLVGYRETIKVSQI